MVHRKHKDFNLSTHAKFWKFYDVIPLGIDKSFKSQYCGYVEGFYGYLYNQEWVKKYYQPMLIMKNSNVLRETRYLN